MTIIKTFSVFLLVSCSTDCSPLTQVNVNSSVGQEFRQEKKDRFSTQVGPEIQLEHGEKASLIYRNRFDEFDNNTMEHGVFFNLSVPVWKKEKK